MARGLNQLTAREVATLKTVGRHSDGGGLYMRITAAGSRSWVFMAVSGGKRAEIGLGAVSNVSLATARRLAAEMREAVAVGADPRQVIAKSEPTQPIQVVTFGTFAEQYIASVEDGWKNPVHRQQWRSSLRDHAVALRDVPIGEVNTDHVLVVLSPIWLSKAETARRLRGRIETILAAAMARGLRPRDEFNPAAFRGHLSVLLADQKGVERRHHAALPYADMPTFMKKLRARPALAARCLEFTILTAARSGEALNATWQEIDLEASLWTVPATRMKANKEHKVPLSSATVDLLNTLMPANIHPEQRIFAVSGVSRSNMAMAMLLRRMEYGHITTHGFRSSFRDWAGEETEFPREVIEHALAHRLADKAEASYRRMTALPKRRQLMQAWANHCDGTVQNASRDTEDLDRTAI